MRGPRTAMKSGPRLPQLEKALAQKRRPNTAKINKLIFKKKKIKKRHHHLESFFKEPQSHTHSPFPGHWDIFPDRPSRPHGNTAADEGPRKEKQFRIPDLIKRLHFGGEET